MALINCPHCGKEITDHASSCPHCGTPIGTKQYCKFCGERIDLNCVVCPKCGKRLESPYANSINVNANDSSTRRVNNTPTPPPAPGKEKNKWVALFLCLCFGYLGVHKFYEGKTKTGIIYLFTVGLFGIGWFIDIIILFKKPNPYYV